MAVREASQSQQSLSWANRIIASLLFVLVFFVICLTYYTVSITRRFEALSQELDRLEAKLNVAGPLDVPSEIILFENVVDSTSDMYVPSETLQFSKDSEQHIYEALNSIEEINKDRDVNILRRRYGWNSDRQPRRQKRQIASKNKNTTTPSTELSTSVDDLHFTWTPDQKQTYEIPMVVVGGDSRRRNKITQIPPAKINQDRRIKNKEDETEDKVTKSSKHNRLEREDKDKRPKQISLAVAHFHAARGDAKTYTSPSRSPVTFPFWSTDYTVSKNNSFFHLVEDGPDKGKVTIQDTGVYMIYAQMLYHDLSGRWSFGVFVGDTERFKCMNSEQIHEDLHLSESSQRGSHSVYQHCYTSGIAHIRKMTQVSVRCLYGHRTVVLQPEFTFWGIVKLS